MCFMVTLDLDMGCCSVKYSLLISLSQINALYHINGSISYDIVFSFVLLADKWFFCTLQFMYITLTALFTLSWSSYIWNKVQLSKHKQIKTVDNNCFLSCPSICILIINWITKIVFANPCLHYISQGF